MHKYLKNLTATDFVVVLFYLFLTLLNIIFKARIPEWKYLVIANFLICSLVFFLAYMASFPEKKIWKQIHYWYLAPLILLTFKELYLMVKPIRQKDYDEYLIQIDRWLFGTDPTVALYSIANPILTEILQIVYASFYFLPIILGIELMINKRYKAFDFALFSIVYGFYLSYLGYFTFPAIGPRFTLHDFYAINDELPGLWLTNFLREFVNWGESITSTMPNAAEHVQRDVFPSGHTQMTLITMYLSVKFRAKTKWFLLPAGSALIFSTVYLRYHYVIDLIAGAAFMIFTMLSGIKLYNYWQKFVGKDYFEYNKV